MIDPAASIGAVRLTISDLERSVRFYESHLGFLVHRRDDRTAWLGAGGPHLLVLSQSETAPVLSETLAHRAARDQRRVEAPRVRRTTGLYHFAILVPTRADLARSLRRLVSTETVMQGAADHGVSEALYLADPDGNGIEIYRDRPRAEWPYAGGELRMGADPIDLDELLTEKTSVHDRAALATGTAMGHVHLHVARLEAAERFYVGVLGFQLMQRYGPSALFVSAGGYHHHIGLNTWAGVGAPPPPPGAIGLRYFELQLPSEAAVEEVAARVRGAGIPIETVEGGLLVRDPAKNAIQLRVR